MSFEGNRNFEYWKNEIVPHFSKSIQIKKLKTLHKIENHARAKAPSPHFVIGTHAITYYKTHCVYIFKTKSSSMPIECKITKFSGRRGQETEPFLG